VTNTPHVIVVGGGPVGLSAALLLDRAGIKCTLLEKEARPNTHPKARGIRTRTMELFDQWGLADEIRASALPAEANRFIYCDSLAGHEIARSPQVELDDRVSFTSDCRAAQDAVQTALLGRIIGIDRINYQPGVSVVGAESNTDGAVVHLDSGASLSCDYVIAADGVRSTIRSALGIELDGDAVLGYGQSIYWHGDLDKWVRERPCIQFITGDRTGQPANIASVDGRYRWVTMVMQPGTAERPEQPTREDAARLIQTAVGADIEPEIVDIATWRISAQVARSWRAGRIFLAGDAAHSFPPTGGFGMNTGIQDVHNLVWKLALVLRAAAPDGLLDTYEAERKDIAKSNAAWSKANGVRFKSISRAIAGGDTAGLDQLIEEQRGHVDATNQDLAFGYPRGALVQSDANADASPLTTARPGHRFPECAVDEGATTVSSVRTIYDRFFLVVHDISAWEGAAESTAEERRLDITTVRVAERRDGIDPLGGHDAALVRPDGVVAWIGDLSATATAEVALSAAFAAVLR
jgi:putative polyketide hydroxylase